MRVRSKAVQDKIAARRVGQGPTSLLVPGAGLALYEDSVVVTASKGTVTSSLRASLPSELPSSPSNPVSTLHVLSQQVFESRTIATLTSTPTAEDVACGYLRNTTPVGAATLPSALELATALGITSAFSSVHVTLDNLLSDEDVELQASADESLFLATSFQSGIISAHDIAVLRIVFTEVVDTAPPSATAVVFLMQGSSSSGGSGGDTAFNGILTSQSANALAVGQDGATNPCFVVDASQEDAVTGIRIQGHSLLNGTVSLVATSSDEDVALEISSKGTGNLTLNASSNSGQIILGGTGGVVLATSALDTAVADGSVESGDGNPLVLGTLAASTQVSSMNGLVVTSGYVDTSSNADLENAPTLNLGTLAASTQVSSTNGLVVTSGVIDTSSNADPGDAPTLDLGTLAVSTQVSSMNGLVVTSGYVDTSSDADPGDAPTLNLGTLAASTQVSSTNGLVVTSGIVDTSSDADPGDAPTLNLGTLAASTQVSSANGLVVTSGVIDSADTGNSGSGPRIMLGGRAASLMTASPIVQSFVQVGQVAAVVQPDSSIIAAAAVVSGHVVVSDNVDSGTQLNLPSFELVEDAILGGNGTGELRSFGSRNFEIYFTLDALSTTHDFTIGAPPSTTYDGDNSISGSSAATFRMYRTNEGQFLTREPWTGTEILNVSVSQMTSGYISINSALNVRLQLPPAKYVFDALVAGSLGVNGALPQLPSSKTSFDFIIDSSGCSGEIEVVGGSLMALARSVIEPRLTQETVQALYRLTCEPSGPTFTLVRIDYAPGSRARLLTGNTILTQADNGMTFLCDTYVHDDDFTITLPNPAPHWTFRFISADYPSGGDPQHHRVTLLHACNQPKISGHIVEPASIALPQMNVATFFESIASALNGVDAVAGSMNGGQPLISPQAIASAIQAACESVVFPQSPTSITSNPTRKIFQNLNVVELIYMNGSETNSPQPGCSYGDYVEIEACLIGGVNMFVRGCASATGAITFGSTT